MATVQQILAAKKDGHIMEKEVTESITKLRYKVGNHKALARWSVVKACNYCKREFTYNLLVGDCNHGACNKASCILRSMQDHL